MDRRAGGRQAMFLGIDLGTSSVKTVLVDGSEAIIGRASARLAVARPVPGWSEQSPADWVDAAFATLDELAAGFPKEVAAVRGIGLSGQMHGATLLDASDAPLRPCILWNDTRAAGAAVESAAIVGGGTRVAPWLKLLSSVLGITLRRVAAGDWIAALGARLAEASGRRRLLREAGRA